MKGYDPSGQTGPKRPLPDAVQIFEPAAEKIPTEPSSDHREAAVPAAAPVEEYAAQETFQQEAYTEQPVF